MSSALPALEEVLRGAAARDPVRAALRTTLAKSSAKTATLLPRVEPAALAMLAALLRTAAGKKLPRSWIVTDGLRAAESAHDQVLSFVPDAVLLPENPVPPVEGAALDPELMADQLAGLHRLFAGPPGALGVLARPVWEAEMPILSAEKGGELVLEKGSRLPLEQCLARLAEAGFERVPQVAERLQFAVRGGIVDLFAAHQVAPLRVEWFGDEIESLREFDVHAQVSTRELDRCEIALARIESARRVPLSEQVGADDLVFEAGERGVSLARGVLPSTLAAAREEEGISLLDLTPRADFWWKDDEIGRELGRQRAASQLEFWQREGIEIVLALDDHEAALRGEIEAGPFANARLVRGRLRTAVLCREAQIAILPATLVLGHRQELSVGARPNWLARTASGIRKRAAGEASEFSEGDLVVHEEHGIARYRGVETGDPETGARLILEFDRGGKIYVPLEQSHRISRYQGLGKARPPLSRLGEARWAGAIQNARRATAEYAARLLSLQARRETETGSAFPPDTDWQRSFEAAFPFQETPDQVRAIAETKRDLESSRPMDRLICGDVGFGKTEVAIRAAFKAAAAGRQVALLAPTTVLAQQHFDNWRKRFADYPIRVELLTRFRTESEQRGVVRDLARGSVDVVIGTHRVVSDDTAFRDLGLLIIDEEQRFGVKHKEKLKERHPLVDILTLSATPIPRTLYMALTGARDLSVLETPPPSRYPVETVICAYDERVIRDAVTRELAREGQVFFLHNRIATIERIATRLQELCPAARIEIGHGQMDEDELDAVMRRFVRGETDVLVSTTIIESGIDIPNANTIVIDRADRFGLADLYQLRGRVGRGTHRAYAFLLLPREIITVGAARKRVEAIRQYSALGAGFQIAMRDLEIRGAGNLLGLTQSGHITAVGFHLYCELLEEAVAALRGKPPRKRAEARVDLDFLRTREAVDAGGELDAFLPAEYVVDQAQRIDIFRQLGDARTIEEVKALRAQLRDRFGRLPVAAKNLLLLTGLRLSATERGIQSLVVRGDKLIIERGGEPLQMDGKFPRLKSADAKSRFSEIIKNVRSL